MGSIRSKARDGDMPPRPRLRNLKSVKEMVEEYPNLFKTEGSLRWLIFNAETTDFTACIVRIGRRVLIDLDLLREWLARNRGTQLPR